MNNTKALAGAALSAPILVMFAWIVSLVLASNSGQEVRLPVVGFDPRDLLSGHYLTYRVDYGSSIACNESGPRCLCLVENGRFHRAITYGSCDELASNCDTHLRGQCDQGRFTAGIERYYFPEQFTSELRVVPPNASITVAIDRDGSGLVTGMDVNGQPIVEWARAQKNQP